MNLPHSGLDRVAYFDTILLCSLLPQLVFKYLPKFYLVSLVIGPKTFEFMADAFGGIFFLSFLLPVKIFLHSKISIWA